MKFIVTIKRVVTEDCIQEVDANTATEALDASMVAVKLLNERVKDQNNHIITSYHLAKVETKKE